MVLGRGGDRSVVSVIKIKKVDTCKIRTYAGEPNAIARRRLNHSAKVSRVGSVNN